MDEAAAAYQKVIDIQPNYVDARINLSTILQNMDRSDEALQTLMDYDLETCSLLPDERLLLRQAEVLFERRRMRDYAKCVRLILIPHFYYVNKLMSEKNGGKQRSRKIGKAEFVLLCNVVETF